MKRVKLKDATGRQIQNFVKSHCADRVECIDCLAVNICGNVEDWDLETEIEVPEKNITIQGAIKDIASRITAHKDKEVLNKLRGNVSDGLKYQIQAMDVLVKYHGSARKKYAWYAIKDFLIKGTMQP